MNESYFNDNIRVIGGLPKAYYSYNPTEDFENIQDIFKYCELEFDEEKINKTFDLDEQKANYLSNHVLMHYYLKKHPSNLLHLLTAYTLQTTINATNYHSFCDIILEEYYNYFSKINLKIIKLKEDTNNINNIFKYCGLNYIEKKLNPRFYLDEKTAYNLSNYVLLHYFLKERMFGFISDLDTYKFKTICNPPNHKTFCDDLLFELCEYVLKNYDWEGQVSYFAKLEHCEKNSKYNICCSYSRDYPNVDFEKILCAESSDNNDFGIFPNLKKIIYTGKKEFGNIPNSVEVIDFSDSKITQITPLLQLSNLKKINSNFITIPDTFVNLTSLNGYFLNIPNTLVNLETLHLSFCKEITEIPDTFVNLKKLYCDYTNITSIPSTLKNLEILHCAGSKKILSLPTTLTKLKNLEVSYTKIVEIPKEFTNLIYLSVNGTEIEELSDTFVNLKILSLYDNKKITQLPRTYLKIEEIYFQSSNLSKIPKEFKNLKMLDNNCMFV